MTKPNRCFKEALKIKEVLGKKHPSYVTTLSNLAVLYREMGQYDKAESLCLEVLKIRKEVLGEKHPDYAKSLNNIAVLYRAMGQYDKAELLFIEAIQIIKEILGVKHTDYANSLNNLAELYKIMRQYDKAESMFNEALKIEKEVLGEKHPLYAQSLNNLAELYAYMGQYEKAELLYSESIKIFEKVLCKKHRDYINSLDNLAALYQIMGQYNKADSMYKEALKRDKEILGEKHPDYVQLLNNLSELYYEMGQYNKAEPLMLESNENYLEQLKTYYPALSENEKVNYLKTVEFNFDFFYSFGIKRIVDNKSISKNIFDIRINTKGLILFSTGNVRKRIAECNDRELVEKYNKFLSLRTEIGKVYTLSFEEQKKKGINLAELESQENELEKEISLKSEDFKSEAEKRVIKFKDFKNNLKQNEAAVEFLDFKYYDKHWTDTTYYCALITRPDLENPKLINLCTLNDLKEYLSASSESENSYIKNEEKSNGLYNLIWKPLEEYLVEASTVFISPSGILNKVSFASLRVDEQNLLIDKYQLRYVGNLKDIIFKKVSESKNKLLTASVFGGIKYDLDSAEMVSNSFKYKSEDELNQYKPDAGKDLREETERGGWGYLKGTLVEAEKIKEILKDSGYEVNEYINEDGSEEAFKSLSGKNSPSILHISTHGFFFPEPEKKYQKNGFGDSKEIYKMSDNPLFRSGLILAGANMIWKGGQEIEGVENGILTAYEVSNMDLRNTELVVLSACETGLGDIKGGEGVYGLQRAFKIAGAKTIIMSLWKVPDKETIDLMELFYTNWLNGMTKHEAFTNAQKEMRKKYAPYYWAAFVMVE